MNRIRMPKYEKLTTADRLHFKALLDSKPFLKVGNDVVSWDVMRKNVQVLSEPASVVNHEKLSMRRGLSTAHVAGDNGRFLVAARIRESNIGALLRKFPHLDRPSWFVDNFNVEEAVDDLFGLRLFNVAVALSVSEPPRRKRKIEEAFTLFKQSHLYPDYGSF